MKEFRIYASIDSQDFLDEKLDKILGPCPTKIDEDGIPNVWLGNPPSRVKVQLAFRDKMSNPSDFDKYYMTKITTFYRELDFEDKRMQGLVLTQLSVTNLFIYVVSDREFAAEASDPIFMCFGCLTNELGGVALVDGHLLDAGGDVLVYPDGSAGIEDFTPKGARSMVLGSEPSSEEGRERKKLSMESLAEIGVMVPDHLSELPPVCDVVMKSRLEIAKHAMAAMNVIMFACDVAKEQMDVEESRSETIENLKRYGVWDQLTDRESDLLNSREPNRMKATQLAWYYEAVWVYLWVLGLVEELYIPDSICDCNHAMQVVLRHENFEAFYATTALRTPPEVLDEADFTYRANWACTQARIDGGEAPGELNEEVAMERLKAFDWLFTRNDGPEPRSLFFWAV